MYIRECLICCWLQFDGECCNTLLCALMCMPMTSTLKAQLELQNNLHTTCSSLGNKCIHMCGGHQQPLGGRGAKCEQLVMTKSKKYFTWVRHTETKMRLKCILLPLKAVINERITNDNLQLLGKFQLFISIDFS